LCDRLYANSSFTVRTASSELPSLFALGFGLLLLTLSFSSSADLSKLLCRPYLSSSS
jgi:hypothetical protein